MIAEIQLTKLFTLETIEQGLYRGISWDLGFPAIFGGQVLGQAVIAAYKTAPENQFAHSFHSYFLLPGDASKPVLYDVEIVRDGRSFSTRRVKAIQDGKTIFYMTISFQLVQPNIEHQHATFPDIVHATELMNDIDLVTKLREPLSDHLRHTLSYHRPIDIRTVDAIKMFGAAEISPERYIWMKSQHELQENVASHQAALAYASDYHFLSTALQAHPITFSDKRLRIATIDHAMWFHKPFDFNQWHVYSTVSPFTGNSRGLVQGQFFNENKELVASTMQEGMIRIAEPKK